MSKTISVHQIEDLAKAELKDEILLGTNINTELHITRRSDTTIIRCSFGNRIDFIGGQIIIHER